MQLIQRLQLVADASLPVGEVKAHGGRLVNAGQVPVTEELRNIRQFIVEPRHVDAQFP